MRCIVKSRSKTSKVFDGIDDARAYALKIAHREHGAEILSESGDFIGMVMAHAGRDSNRNLWMDFTNHSSYEINAKGEIVKKI